MAGPLISAEELAGILHDPSVRIVDCRWYLLDPDGGRNSFHRGHLPGAMYADLERDLSGSTGPGRHPLPAPEDFAATMGRMGIDRSTTVVAYDDRGGAIAARLWWMLTSQGHRHTRVLDGGIQAWEEHGGDLTTVTVRTEQRSFTPEPWTGAVAIDEIAGRPDGETLIDARGRERYEGREEPVDPKAGHIPGAVSLPMTDHLTPDLHLAQPEVLRRQFAAIGVSDTTKATAHCGSGVTACHTILAAELAGLPRPDLYVGSWSDWSSTDRPIVTGPAP